MSKPLVIQFSGGRTSGFMSKFLLEHFPDREKICLFENTGKEHEKTLEFVHECDKRWDLGVVWLEAVVHPDERKSTTHKIVDFESASRNGEPYEAVIKKYGLANMVYTHCTRELKINPANSYIKSLGLKEYEKAIGIRADEAHRLRRETQAKENIIYPLADILPVNKKFILNWWKNQDFDLEVPDYLGNCDMCFKKSVKSLVTISREQPERLIWWQKMGRKYATTGAGAMLEPRRIFRGHRTAEDLLDLALENPTLFETPEYEEEFDCFCKST